MTAADKVYVDIITNVQKSIESLGSYIAKLGMTYLSVHKLIQVSKESIQASLESERATIKLANAFRTQGDYSEQAISNLMKLANSLQYITKYEDEAIVSAQALIKSLTHLDAEAVAKLTPRVLDLAAGLEIDLGSAAMMVGKTIGSTTNAMARYIGEMGTATTETEKLEMVTRAIDMRWKDLSTETIPAGITALHGYIVKLKELQEAYGSIMLFLLEKTARIPESLKAMWDLPGAIFSGQGVEQWKKIFAIGWKTPEKIAPSGSAQGLDEAGIATIEKLKQSGAEMTRLIAEGNAQVVSDWMSQFDVIIDSTKTELELLDEYIDAIKDFKAAWKGTKEEIQLTNTALDILYKERAALVGGGEPSYPSGLEGYATGRQMAFTRGYPVGGGPELPPDLEASMTAMEQVYFDLVRNIKDAAITIASSGIIDAGYAIGRAMMMGAEGADEMAAAFGNLGASIMKNLGALLVNAGISAIMAGDIGVGAGLIGLGIGAAAVGGAMSTAGQPSKTVNVTVNAIEKGPWSAQDLAIEINRQADGW